MDDPGLNHVFEAIAAPDLAAALNISRQAIYQWDKVPIGRAIEIEQITGVPRHSIRPDIWPPPKEGAAA